MVIIQILVLVVVLVLFYNNTDDSSCDTAKNPEECRRMVREFGANRQAFMMAWAINMCIIILFNIWLLLIVRSYLQILELGGDGEEKLSPEQYAIIHGLAPRDETTYLRQ